MSLKNLVPSLWRKGSISGRRAEDHPFYHLQTEMNRLFDDFFSRFFEFPPSLAKEFDTPLFKRTGLGWSVAPAIDINEGEKEIVITAELPGVDEKDIDVSVTEDSITIKGEKKEERQAEGYYHVERSYGYFSRTLPLPAGLDTENAEGHFKRGVLTIKIPRLAEEKGGKKIIIRAE